MSSSPSKAEMAIGAQADEAGARGDVEAVLALLRAHAASAHIVLCALFNLSQLVHSEGQRTTDGADAALAALRAHPNDSGVAGNACCVLGNSVAHSDAARQRVVAEGGIALVAAVLRTHQADDLNCVPTACHALGTLARDPGHAALVAAAGGARLALAALRAHPESAGVASRALTLLGNLAGHSDVFEEAAETLELVMTALKLSLSLADDSDEEEEEEEEEEEPPSDAARVALDSLFCLEALFKHDCENLALSASLMAQDGVVLVVAALCQFASEEQVQYHGLMALLLLFTARGPKRIAALRDAGVEELAQAAAVAYPDVSERNSPGRLAAELLLCFRVYGAAAEA